MLILIILSDLDLFFNVLDPLSKLELPVAMLLMGVGEARAV